MISVGAYLKTFLQSPVDISNRHHSLHLNYWRPLLGGLFGSLLLCAAVQASPLPIAEMASDQPVSSHPTSASITDGVYFYGAVPEPDALGAAYMVFAAHNTRLVGAMFMPQSSFDCFQGQIEGQQLALQITNSYTQEVHGYAIALAASDAPIATVDQAAVPLALDGFHNLGAPRDSEMRLLATCRANFAPTSIEL